jgi:serine/threonine-protein kinase HipA
LTMIPTPPFLAGHRPANCNILRVLLNPIRIPVNMSESRIEKVAGNYHTFYTNRFDRMHGQRIHFTSAMTMTGNNDDTIRDSRASYLDLSAFIQNHGGKIKEDLSQLWRRIAFYFSISYTDDHLRNHGFIIENDAWRLSPAFDVNPSVDKDELALNIDLIFLVKVKSWQKRNTTPSVSV